MPILKQETCQRIYHSDFLLITPLLEDLQKLLIPPENEHFCTNLDECKRKLNF